MGKIAQGHPSVKRPPRKRSAPATTELVEANARRARVDALSVSDGGFALKLVRNGIRRVVDRVDVLRVVFFAPAGRVDLDEARAGLAQLADGIACDLEKEIAAIEEFADPATWPCGSPAVSP